MAWPFLWSVRRDGLGTLKCASRPHISGELGKTKKLERKDLNIQRQRRPEDALEKINHVVRTGRGEAGGSEVPWPKYWGPEVASMRV